MFMRGMNGYSWRGALVAVEHTFDRCRLVRDLSNVCSMGLCSLGSHLYVCYVRFVRCAWFAVLQTRRLGQFGHYGHASSRAVRGSVRLFRCCWHFGSEGRYSDIRTFMGM